MPYFNSLLEYWLLGTIFFYHKDVINIQLVHNLFTHSKTLDGKMVGILVFFSFLTSYPTKKDFRR